MKENINEIIDYFAKASIAFLDLFEFTILPRSMCKGALTNSTSGGLVIALAGSACFTLEGKAYIMKPGMVVHAGPNMCLDKEVVGEESWKYAVIHYKIPKNEMKKFPLYQSHFSFAIGQNAKIPDLLQQLFISQSIPGASALFRTKLLFNILLGEIFDSAKRQCIDSDTAVIEQVMDYIRQNYAEDIII